MKKLLPILMLAPLVGGCDPGALPPATLAPICEALGDPLKYNSSNKMSQRYAAALLAMDLKQRNQVGRNLHCPKFDK